MALVSSLSFTRRRFREQRASLNLPPHTIASISKPGQPQPANVCRQHSMGTKLGLDSFGWIARLVQRTCAHGHLERPIAAGRSFVIGLFSCDCIESSSTRCACPALDWSSKTLLSTTSCSQSDHMWAAIRQKTAELLEKASETCEQEFNQAQLDAAVAGTTRILQQLQKAAALPVVSPALSHAR